MNLITRLIVTFLPLVLSSTSLGGTDPNYCDSSGACRPHKVAVNFGSGSQLLQAQVQLLSRAGIGLSSRQFRNSSNYEEWVIERDYEAAAFLAITKVLNMFEVKWPDGNSSTFLALVKNVKRFAGDRLYVELDKPVFESWMQSGAEFVLHTVNGKDEKGNFKFHNGTALGGSLHKGYDTQGFTSVSKTPRIQINYRYSDAEADIDLDGYAPLIWGVIPNPKHLTYENSDPRQWLDSYVKKFGPPGFQVKGSESAQSRWADRWELIWKRQRSAFLTQ